MKPVFVIVVCCLVLVVAAVLLVRSRIAPTYAVTSRDIPEVVNQLQRSAKNGHFAVLMFVPPGATDGLAVNLQYSIDGGVVGLDWVLISPRNIADQEKIKAFASKLGYNLDEHEMNKTRYLRVTGNGISELGAKIIRDFYTIAPEAQLEMITEGFKWHRTS